MSIEQEQTAKHLNRLEVIRHSTAHLLAQAVKRLYPDAQVAIGPVIEEGFYYDFYYPKGFSESDLELIEKEMKALAKKNLAIEKKVLNREEAIALFSRLGETYKLQIIDKIPQGERITAYQQGDFVDLCRGPHVDKTGELKAFKLTRLAGAYWLGDANREMLQRIYGTAFETKTELKCHLERIEEAKRRDHRKLGLKMSLFHLQPEAAGMVFWHAKGWLLYQQVQAYIRRYYHQKGYLEVATPQLIHRHLLERSGHWGKFGETGIFTTASEQHEYAIRPMNCPCHVALYNQGVTSYRDLPIRFAEFGACYRNEPSGTLHGLMRVRGFVQDDGHIFCTQDQVHDEVVAFVRQAKKVYQDFGFTDILVRLATRPDVSIGDDSTWHTSEGALKTAIDRCDLAWELAAGEGAFYGPKIEFALRDCLGRTWQCGTIQLDFYVPGRLDAYYIAEDGSKQTPVMLHRAILGSLERFIGILLEHTAGNLPVWLSPVQVLVANISEKQEDYGTMIAKILKEKGFRVQLDLRNEKIGYKIRESAIARIPYLLILGDNEKDQQCITVRTQSGQQLGMMTLEDFIAKLSIESQLPDTH